MAIWSEKKYNRINWQNRPSTATALGATNLNKIDVFCNEVDNAMIQMDAQKLNLSTANSMISSLTINVDTGVITAKQLDGTTFTWDLNLEKIPVSFSLSEDGILTMTTEDGTEWTCNISELIKDYVFDDSDTIAFEKEFSEEDESGKGAYHVTASVKAGSINETHLDPDYRADILTYKNQALTAANDSLTYSKDSKRWAVGDVEYEGSATDNSKYYKEQAEAAKVAAEQARDEAQAATGTVIATTTQVGVVKPDGTTIDVTSDGTISAKQATSTTHGIIKPDGETVTVDEYGVLHGAQKFDEEGYVFVDNETVIPPGQEDEAILDADKLGGELPSYYAKQDDVGEKTNLTTAAKTDLVASINEVDGNIGDLSGLTTAAKTNLVAAVNELNQKIQNKIQYDVVEENENRDLYLMFQRVTDVEFVNGVGYVNNNLSGGDRVVRAFAQPENVTGVVIASCQAQIANNRMELHCINIDDGTPYSGSTVGYINLFILVIKDS